MKRVIKNQKKMKNTMYIVFGVFALALFGVTMLNPSYAEE
jgi:predicted nucleic acid-binding Zn ribbon protein